MIPSYSSYPFYLADCCFFVVVVIVVVLPSFLQPVFSTVPPHHRGAEQRPKDPVSCARYIALGGGWIRHQASPNVALVRRNLPQIAIINYDDFERGQEITSRAFGEGKILNSYVTPVYKEEFFFFFGTIRVERFRCHTFAH